MKKAMVLPMMLMALYLHADTLTPPDAAKLATTDAKNAQVAKAGDVSLNPDRYKGKLIRISFMNLQATDNEAPSGYVHLTAYTDILHWGDLGHYVGVYFPTAMGDFASHVAAAYKRSWDMDAPPQKWVVYAYVDNAGKVWALGKEVREKSFGEYEFVW
ncbi:MAG: hypothetical protein QM796_04500 [Chthoniobacteraceae bacterium]